MTYDEWLALLKRIEKSSSKEDIEAFINEPANENLKPYLVPKLKDAIIDKFNYNIGKIIDSLETIFIDEEELDLPLVTFKKAVKTVMQLIDNNQLSEAEKTNLRNEIIKGTEDSFNALEKSAALQADTDNGVSLSIIKRNRIKWSDDSNELPRN